MLRHGERFLHPSWAAPSVSLPTGLTLPVVIPPLTPNPAVSTRQLGAAEVEVGTPRRGAEAAGRSWTWGVLCSGPLVVPGSMPARRHSKLCLVLAHAEQHGR